MKGLVLLALLSGHGMACDYAEIVTDEQICNYLQSKTVAGIEIESIWHSGLCGIPSYGHSTPESQFKQYLADNPVCDYYLGGQLGDDAHWMIMHSDLCGYTAKSPSVKTSVLDAGIVAFFEYTEKSDYCDNQENMGMDQTWRYDVCQYRDRNINWYE